jgi:hypothetical protein
VGVVHPQSQTLSQTSGCGRGGAKASEAQIVYGVTEYWCELFYNDDPHLNSVSDGVGVVVQRGGAHHFRPLPQS